jgi:hypothetical protein
MLLIRPQSPARWPARVAVRAKDAGAFAFETQWSI